VLEIVDGIPVVFVEAAAAGGEAGCSTPEARSVSHGHLLVFRENPCYRRATTEEVAR
jgi:hypothetical protein